MTLVPFWIGLVGDGEPPYLYCDECWFSFSNNDGGLRFHEESHSNPKYHWKRDLERAFENGVWIHHSATLSPFVVKRLY